MFHMEHWPSPLTSAPLPSGCARYTQCTHPALPGAPLPVHRCPSSGGWRGRWYSQKCGRPSPLRCGDVPGQLRSAAARVQVCSPGVHLPLGDGDERFTAAVLGQTQHCPGVAFRQAVVQHELPLVLSELQKPQLVGQCRLSHAKPLGRLRLVQSHKTITSRRPCACSKGFRFSR